MNASEMIKVTARNGQIVLTARNSGYQLVLLATTWKALVGVSDGPVQEIILSGKNEGLAAVSVTFTNGANTRIVGAFFIPLSFKEGIVSANVSDIFVPPILVQMVVTNLKQDLEIRTDQGVLLPLSFELGAEDKVTVPVITMQLLEKMLKSQDEQPQAGKMILAE